MWSVEEVVQKILATRDQIPRQRSVLVALSGIDASGKGYIAARIVAGLRARGIGVANINVDGWLNLPRKRFNPANPGEHFYLNAVRFDELFSQLVLPLRDHRSLRIETDYAEERATEYRRHTIYFPAQDLHFRRDDPRGVATAIVNNDPRLGT